MPWLAGSCWGSRSSCSRVLKVLPRGRFKPEFVALLQAQADRKPRCRVRQALEAGFAELVVD